MTTPVTPLTPSAIVSQMRAALSVSEPDLDTSIGSTTRKILDAVAASIAPAYSDQYLLSYAWSIDSKTGSDLDDFVAMLGFTRFPAGRATGIITFARATAAATDINIPAGVQVTSADGSVTVSTVVPGLLLAGATTVEIPVQAVTAGVAGNATAYTLTLFATQLEGVTSVYNSNALSGGTDPETDEALTARFKKTALRSLAGVDAMYLAVALDPASVSSSNSSPVVTSANVLGSSRRWREQIQVEGGSATSTIPASNVKKVFGGTQFVGADIDNGQILAEGTDYSFDAVSIPPVVASTGGLVNGNVYDLDFEYIPAASRNDDTISNRVDIWVNGVDATLASQIVYMRYDYPFMTEVGSTLDVTKFVRLGSADVQPSAGNYFVRLAFGPILTFPESLTVGGTTYTLGTDYWVVHDDTANGYGPNSRYGIEWLSSNAPVDGDQITLTSDVDGIGTGYTYNRIPWAIAEAVSAWGLLTTDVQVHAAKPRYLAISLAVMVKPHVDFDEVTNAATQAVSSWLARNGFDAALQTSDLLQVVHNVTGVDNVRFITAAENPAYYAWQRVTDDGVTTITTYASGGRAVDIVFGDDEIPVLSALYLVPKAQNTFSAGA